MKGIRKASGANIAEFAPAIFVLFLVILFPLINLLAIASGFATATLIANQCATAAAVSQTYNDALNSMSNTALTLTSSPLGKFAGLQPMSGYGYQGCGVDLYVAVTNVGSNSITVYGPNTPLAGPIDTTNNIYEYEARVSYAIGPFLSMAGTPIFTNVPGLGKPADFQLAVQKAAEYPYGLVGLAGLASNGPGNGLGGVSGTVSGGLGTGAAAMP